MAKMVFALKNVPEDEANDIRALLQEASIDFYETTAGRWQVSLAGIWVRDASDFQRAREIIHADQIQRERLYSAQRPAFWPSLLSHFIENPVEFVFVVLALMFIIGLSLLPFLFVL